MSLLNWMQKLKEAKSIAALDQLLKNYLEACQITGYTFSYFAQTTNQKKNRLQHEVVSERMRSWHDYYHEQHYEGTDATIQSLHKNLLPMAWNVAEQLKHSRTEKERKMRQESLDFGVTEGLSIPLHGVKGDYAELTLRQFSNESCLKEWPCHQAEWYMIALAYFNALCVFKLHEEPEGAALLTKREFQCLKCLAEKYTPAEIAVALKMTERTVNFHIQNINRKLKARNKYEALTKALSLGLLLSSPST